MHGYLLVATSRSMEKNQSGAQINGLVTIGILLHFLCEAADYRACELIIYQPSTIWLGSISCMHGYLLVATSSSMEKNQSGAQIDKMVTIGFLLHILCDTADYRACEFTLY
jgi:hypothetical protein